MPATQAHKQIAEAKLWRADDLADAEFLRGRFVNYSYDPHTHALACFALITHGAIRIKVRGGEFVARAGDLFAVDAGVVHEGWPIGRGGWKQRTLYAGLGTLAASVGGDPGRKSSIVLAGPLIQDAELSSSFLDLHRHSERGRDPLGRAERYFAFVARLFERHARLSSGLAAPGLAVAGREDLAIRRAREFLEQRLDAHVHLADIAEVAGLPPFRLLRAFVRATGMPPHAYRRQVRLRIATGLIRRGRPLGEVAVASGFADQAHMTRTFRRMLGLTPGTYQAAFR